MVTPVGSGLVVDDTGEARSKFRVIREGHIVEVSGNSGTECVVLGDHYVPVIAFGTRNSNSRGAGSEGEYGSREAHTDERSVGWAKK